MSSSALLKKQAEMRARCKSRVEVHESKREIKRALKVARAVCKKKHRDHLHYLALKKEKRKLTRALRDELRTALVEWRTLCKAMREAEQVLRGALGDREKQSKQFLAGLEAGREEARIKERQKELDQAGPEKEIQK